MSSPPTERPDAPDPPPVARGAVIGAWIAVVLTAVVLMTVSIGGGEADDDAVAGVSLQVELTGKMLVALKPAFRGYEAMFQQQFDQTAVTDRERLCGAILAGELTGPDQAVEILDALAFGASDGTEPEPELLALRDALRALYGDLAADRGVLPSVNDDQHAAIQDELGWFGRLALHAPGVADQAARDALLRPLWRIPLVILGVLCWFGLCAVTGTVVLIVLLVWAKTGRLHHGFSGSGRGAIYAETFALWFVWFFGFQLLAKALLPEGVAMPAGLAIFWLSLLALAWPVKRGIPWRQVRQDVGLTFGRGPVTESLAGVIAYLVSVPLLIIGAIVFVALSLVLEAFSPGGAPPSHPVQETIAGGDWPVIVMVFFLACVAAPVVEETMFRGVLYRHLREATGRMGLAMSVAFSAVFSSFLFAVIHPQGWVFAPVLTGLAVAFCLAREWRGSLVACMVAHGITNALALTMNLALFRGV